MFPICFPFYRSYEHEYGFTAIGHKTQAVLCSKYRQFSGDFDKINNNNNNIPKLSYVTCMVDNM